MQTCHKVRRPDTLLRRAIARGEGAGDYQMTGNRPIRKTVPSIVPRSTLDTPEHRWIRRQLSDIQHRLQKVHTKLTTNRDSQKSAWSESQQRLELAQIENLLDHVYRMQESRCLAMASSVVQPDRPSLVLLRAPGYREVHEILHRLRSSLVVDIDSLRLHIRDLPRLYQLWCYLKIVELLGKATGDQRNTGDLIRCTDSGTRLNLRGGKDSEITFEMDQPAQWLRLSYQPRFDGETGRQEPDIVLQIGRQDGTSIMIVLDAKYRLDATERYQKTYGSPGPPIEAINSLHRYRDAIVSCKMRPVVQGVALFPFPRDRNDEFKSENRLYEALTESLGIGALPFLPDNVSLVEEWLHHLLELPSDKLVSIGPPRP